MTEVTTPATPDGVLPECAFSITKELKLGKFSKLLPGDYYTADQMRDALEQQAAALQAAMRTGPGGQIELEQQWWPMPDPFVVACHRTVTGNGEAWAWIDGPPSLGALDNLKVHPTWRIEYAYRRADQQAAHPAQGEG